VLPAQTVTGDAGCYAPAGGPASIAILNDTSAGLFKIAGVKIFRVEPVVIDGELPPGVNRRPVLTWQLVQVAQFSGSQPFQVAAGQVVDVTLAFTAPTQPTGVTYTASVQVASSTWSRMLPVTGTSENVDFAITWSLVNPYGIEFEAGISDVNPFTGTWNSGHANDALILQAPSTQAGALLVGSDSGGVWKVNSSAFSSPTGMNASCNSDDWDTPGVICLCQGPDDAEHVYAGTADVLFGNQTGYVYETSVVGIIHTVDAWHAVSDPNGIPKNFQSVYRMAVVHGSPNRLVLATTIGVFWANIPAPGGNYVWNQVTKMADGTAFPSGAYSGLARGPGSSVVVAAYGVDIAGGRYGIFYGDWSSGDLTMTRSTLPSAPPQSFVSFPEGMYRTSLASSLSQTNQMYAIAGDPDSIYAVLRSSDGGKTWVRPYDPAPAPTVFSKTDPTVSGSLFDHASKQGGYNNVIAVSHGDAQGNIVVLGWESGTYLSIDGGKTWQFLSGPGLHSDVHGLYFSPADASGRTLYICSDGGVMMTHDLGQTFDSSANKNLANLQFYSTTAARDFYGTMSLSSPFLAAGSQDNGNLYCVLNGTWGTGVGGLYGGPSPWVKFEGGDGGPVMFLATKQMMSAFNDAGSTLTGRRPLQSLWNLWLVDSSTPVLIVNPGKPDDKQPLPKPVTEAVGTTQFSNGQGQLMYAVAAPLGSLLVYGLFAAPNGDNLHAEPIGSVQSDAANDVINALACPDGVTVLIGTVSGRMFRLAASANGPVAAQPLLVQLPAGTPGGSVPRIVAVSPSLAFAGYNSGWNGRLLKFDGTTWKTSDNGLPGYAYQGLALQDTGNKLFAATPDRVFVSRDSGNSWLDCSAGLPRQPHCSDLQFFRDPVTTQGGLYLSTFGRSVWVAGIPDD
jgi:hypothetical protein